MLSQKTTLAENLLNQFGGNKVTIKQEASDEVSSGEKFAQAADSTTKTVKCEATSTSARKSIPKYEVKSEPVLKLEKLVEPIENLGFSLNMTSKQVIETVK